MNARYLLSNLLEYTGANAAALVFRRESLTVLAYHRVLDACDPARSTTQPAMVTSTHVFERQMEIIAERFHPITLSDAVRWLDGHGQIANRAVLVTFDDGWSDTYTNAFPAMKRLGIPGVVFLATGFIGTDRRQWADEVYESVSARSDSNTALHEVERLKAMPHASRLDEIPLSPFRSFALSRLNPIPNLTWPQIEEMATHGFAFGSHTRNHLILPHEPEDEALNELQHSTQDIERDLGTKPAAFAYPDGQYDDQSVRLVEQTGYSCAFTCDEGAVTRRSPLFALPRLCMHDGVSATRAGNFSRSMFLTYLAGTIPWRYRRSVR